MVVSPPNSSEDPAMEPIVFYRKPAGTLTSYDSTDTSNPEGRRGRHFGGFEAECCCNCTTRACLFMWSIFVLIAAVLCFADTLLLFFIDPYHDRVSNSNRHKRYVFTNKRTMQWSKTDSISKTESSNTQDSNYNTPQGHSVSVAAQVEVPFPLAMIILYCAFTGLVILISGALVMAATCRRNLRILKVSLFFIIFAFGFFFIKDLAMAMLILTDHNESEMRKILQLSMICYIIIVVIIKRALG